jgi:hypothetical protein
VFLFLLSTSTSHQEPRAPTSQTLLGLTNCQLFPLTALLLAALESPQHGHYHVFSNTQWHSLWLNQSTVACSSTPLHSAPRHQYNLTIRKWSE